MFGSPGEEPSAASRPARAYTDVFRTHLPLSWLVIAWCWPMVQSPEKPEAEAGSPSLQVSGSLDTTHFLLILECIAPGKEMR